jgi:hypothetical protein
MFKSFLGFLKIFFAGVVVLGPGADERAEIPKA